MDYIKIKLKNKMEQKELKKAPLKGILIYKL